ncbi:hypothetical protein L1I79_17710 [Strepomyces sp. STD 3.1]|nr:hypothetical protein [Streptomyces sp. STD 3.1]
MLLAPQSDGVSRVRREGAAAPAARGSQRTLRVVLNSLDEARELDTAALDDARRPTSDGELGSRTTVVSLPAPDSAVLAERIAGMRQALDTLEQSLAAQAPVTDGRDRVTTTV